LELVYHSQKGKSIWEGGLSNSLRSYLRPGWLRVIIEFASTIPCPTPTDWKSRLCRTSDALSKPPKNWPGNERNEPMALKKCPYCQAIIDEKIEYCSNCGTQLLFPEDEAIEEDIPGDKIIKDDRKRPKK
jgi:hypothetical protein